MDHNEFAAVPELEKLLSELDQNESNDRHFLPDEVRFSELGKLSDKQLEGRLAYYERDYTFELNKEKRAEFYREVLRTKIELANRAHGRRIAARIALMPAPSPAQAEARVDADAEWSRATHNRLAA